MEEIVEKKYCSGCLSCLQRCPKGAISIIGDEGGFKYPKINVEKCINCGICKKVCPILKKQDKNSKLPDAYACINKDKNTRINSSSGGIFSLLANYIIDNGGYVFGAAYDENFDVTHKSIFQKEQIKELMGSKYVQSNTSDIYKEVEKNLNENKLVLFTGTPCQIEGLKSYLKKDYDNLITQDIICHGVPSPKLWRKYLKYKNLEKDNITKINMRDKKNGWKNYNMMIDFSDSYYRKSHTKDEYMHLFLNDICLRESCYNCKFKKLENKLADITLGDFWGIENILPQIDDDLGVTLVLVNSDKGKKIFKQIFSNMIVEDVDLQKSIAYNSALLSSVKENKKRNNFFRDINIYSFEKLYKKYRDDKHKLLKKVYNKVKRILKLRSR